MGDPRSYEARKADEYRKAYEAREAANALQKIKLQALQDTLGNYGNFRYVDFNDFLDPDNKNWADYTYKTPGGLFSRSQGHIDAGTPEGIFINNIRNAETIGNVYKQSELWNSFDPLSSRDRARKYFRYIFGGKEPDPVQATAGGVQGVQAGNVVARGGTQDSNNGSGGTQGVVTVGGTQGAQAGNNSGATQGVQGVQASNTGGISTGGGTASTQGVQAGAQTGGTGGTTGNGKPRMSDDEIDAFLNEELGGNTTDGTYASSGVPKGGTKTIGYDPNPGNVSLAYTMRNAPEPARRGALIDKWDREHGRSGSTYATPGISTGGTYATSEGIKDANGNVLTNPGGNWEYQYALRDPSYGVLMRDRMSDAQKNYWKAVSNNMGYNYDL